MTKPGEIAKVSFRISLAVSITVVIIIVIVLYISFPAYRDHIKFISSLVGGGAVVYAAYYAGISLHFTLQQTRRDKSFEMLHQLNEIDRTLIRAFIEKEIDAVSTTPKETYEKITENKEIFSQITSLLGYFEDLSIAIQYDYLDEEVLYKSLAFLIPWTRSKLEGFISQARAVNDSRLYVELEKLAKCWESNRSLRTSKVFPAI